ncbi:AsmA-like C-terminal domain-containing protein [Helicobacter baculiformis]|uniref:AsmA-like C-terminal domain-containing protein n=1 Tax=Helicobacter baculiformis TaxID=427351 RepID=A0ABV7ZI73_9HELI|nr:AsmA-like C-terminal domain-containing protein [Helicobacter baculiformis]
MIKTISKKMFRLMVLGGVLGTLLLGVWLVLKSGISIPSIHLGKVHIEGLYLKLDNKFVLDVKRLDISALLNSKPKKAPPRIDDVVQGIKYSILALSYFQKLTVQEIVLNASTKAHVLFDGSTYEVAFPGIEVKFLLENSQQLRLKLLHCILAPYHIRALGHASYDNHSKQLSFALELFPLNDVPHLRKSKLIVRAQGLSDFSTLALKLSTNEIRHLDFLRPYFSQGSHPVVQAWLFDNIEFSSVRIDTAKAMLDLKDKQLLKTLLDRVSAQAIVKDARVRFQSKLAPIVAKEVALELKDRALIIAPKNVFYETMPLENSRVQISNLGKGSYLSADIKIAPSLSFKSTKKLLQAYNITLPIEKFNTLLSADLLLGVQFIPKAHALISVQGSIIAQQGTFLLYGTPLFTQQASIALDITPEHNNVFVDTLHTRYHNIADVDTRLMLDFTQKRIFGTMGVHKLQINTNNAINIQPFSPHRSTIKKPPPAINITHLPNILAQGKQVLEQYILASIKAQNKEVFSQDVIYATSTTLPNLEFNLDFSTPHAPSINLGSLGVEGRLKEGVYSLEVKDLRKLFPISPLLRYFGIKKGTLSASTADFKNIEFVGIIKHAFPLYHRDGKRLDTLSFLGTCKPDSMEIFTHDGAIMGKIKDKQKIFFFNDINFNLDEFLDSKIPFVKELLAPSAHRLTKAQIRDENVFIRAKQSYEKRHHITPISTIISASNITITLKSFPLSLENIRLIMRDGQVSIDGAYHHAMLNADIIHGDVIIKANNFSGDYLNLALQSVISKNIIGGGLYSLTGIYRDQVFNGELRMQNTTIKNFKVLQNIVNIINTIPSLIVFRNPRLGAHGYEIAKGRVLFGVSADYLGLEHIQLSGTTLDVDGNGIIAFSTKKVDLSLDISTIKGFSNVINKIPIVNYLILGNRGKISTHVQVGKTLDNPSIKVTLAKDIAQAPFKILRRIFTPIDIIIEEIKKGLADHDTPRLPEGSTLHNP